MVARDFIRILFRKELNSSSIKFKNPTGKTQSHRIRLMALSKFHQNLLARSTHTHANAAEQNKMYIQLNNVQ